MTGQEIINHIEKLGLHCRLNGGNVNLTPTEKVTVEIKALVLASKGEVVAALKSREQTIVVDPNLDSPAMTDDERLEIVEAMAAKNPKRQVSCRGFEFTRIMMATRAEHCIEQQGDNCGDCELRARPP